MKTWAYFTKYFILGLGSDRLWTTIFLVFLQKKNYFFFRLFSNNSILYQTKYDSFILTVFEYFTPFNAFYLYIILINQTERNEKPLFPQLVKYTDDLEKAYGK